MILSLFQDSLTNDETISLSLTNSHVYPYIVADITVNWSLLHLETSENGSLQLTLIVYGVTSYEANLSISVHSPNGQGMLA